MQFSQKKSMNCYHLTISLWIAFTLIEVDSRPNIEHDAFLDTVGLIRKFGYPVEQHTLVTSDGYLLPIVRIPVSRSIPKSFKTRPGPPVLFIHGIISSADDWVINQPWNSPGFLMSDAGYDVWLLNNRGTPYSKHVKYNKVSKGFWDFSFDDIGTYDVPCAIDFVLQQTGYDQLTLVGWSQGSTNVFVTLSLRPEYNAKVKLFAAMAPVANITHLKSPITLLVPFRGIIKKTIDSINGGGIFPSSWATRFLYHHFCNSPIRGLCYLPVSVSVGISPQQLNRTRIPVYMAHMPAGTSTKNLIHFVQIRASKQFQRFDYGEDTNMWRYGTPYPPRYPLHKITAPVALFSGNSDRFASPEDVSSLRREIRQALVYDYLVPDPDFAHLDFTIGYNARRILHDPLIGFVNRFHREEQLGLYRPDFHSTYFGPPIPPFPLPPLDLHKNPSGRPVLGVKFASMPVSAAWQKNPPLLDASHLPTMSYLAPLPPTHAVSSWAPPTFQDSMTKSNLLHSQMHSPVFDFGEEDFPSDFSFSSHNGPHIFSSIQHETPETPATVPHLYPFMDSKPDDVIFSQGQEDSVDGLQQHFSSNAPSSHGLSYEHQDASNGREPLNIQIEEVNHDVHRPLATEAPPTTSSLVDFDTSSKPIIMHPDSNGGFQTDWLPVLPGANKLNYHDLLPAASSRLGSKANSGDSTTTPPGGRSKHQEKYDNRKFTPPGAQRTSWKPVQ